MLTKEQLEDLEGKHGRIVRLFGKPYTRLSDPPDKKPEPGWECVFRKPTRNEYKQFRSRTHKPDQVADAQEVLARQCIVYPTREAFDALLDDYPAIPEAAAGALGELVGITADDTEK